MNSAARNATPAARPRRRTSPPLQEPRDLPDRVPSVGDRVLLRDRHLGERLVVALGQEDRVEPEPLEAPRLSGDAPPTLPMEDVDVAPEPKPHHGLEPRRAALHAIHQAEQPADADRTERV